LIPCYKFLSAMKVTIVRTCGLFADRGVPHSCHERTILLLKKTDGLRTMGKFGPRQDVARAVNNLRANNHPLSAPNDLKDRTGEGTLDPLELGDGKPSAAWCRSSSRTRRSIQGNLRDL